MAGHVRMQLRAGAEPVGLFWAKYLKQRFCRGFLVRIVSKPRWCSSRQQSAFGPKMGVDGRAVSYFTNVSGKARLPWESLSL